MAKGGGTTRSGSASNPRGTGGNYASAYTGSLKKAGDEIYLKATLDDPYTGTRVFLDEQNRYHVIGNDGQNDFEGIFRTQNEAMKYGVENTNSKTRTTSSSNTEILTETGRRFTSSDAYSVATKILTSQYVSPSDADRLRRYAESMNTTGSQSLRDDKKFLMRAVRRYK